MLDTNSLKEKFILAHSFTIVTLSWQGGCVGAELFTKQQPGREKGKTGRGQGKT
jgi:hypothetical protein